MLKLKAIKYEALTSLLYVADQEEKVYVIVDRGKAFEFIGRPRFRLHACGPNGEIRRLIDDPWILIASVERSVFSVGLSGNMPPDLLGKHKHLH
jgi:hypothetical protein